MRTSKSSSMSFSDEKYTPLPLPIHTSISSSNLSDFIDLRPTSSCLSGSSLPDTLVKENMIKMIRNYENNERKLKIEKKTRKKKQEFTSDMQSLSSNEEISDEDDSERFMRKFTYDTNTLKNKLLSKSSENCSNPFQNSSNFNYLKMKEGTKVSNLLHMSDDYSIKWLKMKEKRDIEREKLENSKKKNDFLNNFHHFINVTEKNNKKNYFLIKNEPKLENKNFTYQNYLKNNEIKENRRKKLENFKLEKKIQAQEVKLVIEMNKNYVQTAQQQELKNFHESINQNRENSFTLDSNSTTIIQVPNKLKEDIKKAKSLNVYNKAREDLKLYHDTILSERISNHAKNKQLAKIKALNSSK